MLEDKWSWRRFLMFALIVATTALSTLPILLERDRTMEERALALLCGLLFAMFFILYLEWNRKEKGIFHEKANNLTRVALYYLAASALNALISFLPGELRPVVLAPAMMALALDAFAGLLCSGYFAALLCMAREESAKVLICHLLLGMLACVLVPYMKKKRGVVWGCFMVLGMSFCLNAIFCIWDQRVFQQLQLTETLAGALASCLGMALLFHFCSDKIDSSREHFLVHILDERYRLVKAMKECSQADYDHAKRVSEIARGCAEQIGANAALCAAAGFYYRIGRLAGEPYVKKGIALAKKRRFPPELIKILAEYNGEEMLPSTVESAVVHIVDNLVVKFDMLDKSTISSSWSQDMVIYQTLNDNSALGLYDASGLSMNVFLKVRDYLIKEAPIYDYRIRRKRD